MFLNCPVSFVRPYPTLYITKNSCISVAAEAQEIFRRKQEDFCYF